MKKAGLFIMAFVACCVCNAAKTSDIRTDGRVTFAVPDGFRCDGSNLGVKADGTPMLLFRLNDDKDRETTLISDYEKNQSKESFESYWEQWRDQKVLTYETGVVDSGEYKVNGSSCFYRVLGYNAHGKIFYWHYYVLFHEASHKMCVVSTYIDDKVTPPFMKSLVESVRFDKKSANPVKPYASVKRLPKGCSEKKAFGLDFSYGGYVFQGNLYPLHDGRWVVLSRWCIDEEGTIYTTNKDGEEVPAASQYKDPFGGSKYPVIPADSVYFWTRNYGGQAIRFYSSAGGKDFKDTVNFECPLQAVDADIKTRRILCRTNPSDQIWSEPENDDEKEWKRPYVSVEGWIDEEWVCANLLTTCP